MKLTFSLAFSFLLLAPSLQPAVAQPPHKLQRHPSKTKLLATGGVETITPQEPLSKDTGPAAAWNGSYIGVNARMGFETTAGTNFIVPMGTGINTER